MSPPLPRPVSDALLDSWQQMAVVWLGFEIARTGNSNYGFLFLLFLEVIGLVKLPIKWACHAQCALPATVARAATTCVLLP